MNSVNFTLIKSFRAHTSGITRIKQSPIQSISIATCSSDDTQVKVWNTNLTLIQTYSNHTGGVNGLEYINTETIASGDKNGLIQIWSIRTGLTRTTIKTTSAISSLLLLSNGFYLACGLSNNINIYNINNGSLIANTFRNDALVEDLALISDASSLIASSWSDGTILIWNHKTNANTYLYGHTGGTFGLKLITSTSMLASGSLDKTIILWNVTSRMQIRKLENHTDSILNSLDLLNNENGLRLVSGSLDKTIKLWNLTTGQLLNTINTDLKISSLAVLSVNLLIKSKFIFEINYNDEFSFAEPFLNVS